MKNLKKKKMSMDDACELATPLMFKELNKYHRPPQEIIDKIVRGVGPFETSEGKGWHIELYETRERSKDAVVFVEAWVFFETSEVRVKLFDPAKQWGEREKESPRKARAESDIDATSPPNSDDA